MTEPLVNTPPRDPRAPYWRNTTSTLYVGDARDVLAEMPDGSADCIVTSPPYWGKRDYRVVGQYGHEPDPAAYVNTLRATFTEARRVLADDGTCWLNLGDSYSAGGGGATGLHAYLGRNLAAHRDAEPAGQEPARPAVAGRLRPPGRRLDSAQRDRLAQTQRHARIGPRPAQLPLRADLPARQAVRLLVRPGPDPHSAQDRPGRLGRPAATARPEPAAEVWPARPPGRRRPAVRHRPEPPRAPERP